MSTGNDFIQAGSGLEQPLLSDGATDPVTNARKYTNVSDDPFFVNSAENIGASLVSQKLTGIENYVTWRKFMMRALSFKSKLGFIRGIYPKPADPFELERWEKCNNAVLTWITNSVSDEIARTLVHIEDCKMAWENLQRTYGVSNGPMLFSLQEEISSLKQGDMTVQSYHAKLKNLWGDEDSMTSQDVCETGSTCKATQSMLAKKDLDRSIKFLMGL